jgi:regulator of protease activity HflC (stomatin/prohibitin superfamily)
MTVQATNEDITIEYEEGSDTSTSANLKPMNIVFLDQVDADATASARFRLPTDCDSFLRMAREYRTPDNLLNTALVPAFKETLEANASLMGADDYYSGGRNKFNTEFSNQLENGLYIVERKEIRQTRVGGPAHASANATKGTDQEEYGDGKQTIFVVEKIADVTGVPLRKKQAFSDFGIQVVESRITGMIPNVQFKKRMDLKQQASADRAIAREQRIQEEQQKLLVEAKGERIVAERQATWKADQIEQTTQAETRKQLALTEASKKMEQADIDKQTAQILLDKAQIDAKAVVVAADAEAYQKEVILKADNALAQKLETEVKIQGLWADAFAKRQVPEIVMGGNGGEGTPVGSNSEVKDFMSLMTVEAAKNLRYNRTLGAPLDAK